MPVIEKSAAAEEDLINIWLYTYQEWDEAQADHYLDGIEGALKLLSGSPLICPEQEELTPPVRIHSHNYHLIVYEVTDDGIYIIRVLHENMDIDERLGDS